MGRGSTQVLIRKIVECLMANRKSIGQISKETGFDRTAIVKYLNLLTDEGILIEEQEGTRKFFSIVPTYRTDTFFGLPLDEETEKKFYSIYFLIRKYWKEQSTQELFKTHAQKIGYKVINECNLNLPFGWYLYGGIGVVSYENSMEYQDYGVPKEVIDCVKEVTAEYVKNDTAWKSKLQQYEEEDKELYIVKEKILAILYSPKFDSHPKNSLYVMIKLIRKLISLAPKDDRPEYLKFLDLYQDLMFDLSNIDEDVLSENKREIIILFEAIWKYIALFNFKNDLSGFYSEKILDSHFKLDILQQEDEIIEIGTELQSIIPVEEPDDLTYKKIREIRGKDSEHKDSKGDIESKGKELRKEFGL